MHLLLTIDENAAPAHRKVAMKINLTLIAATALIPLSACGESEPEVVGGIPDPMAEELANAAPIAELPPMIQKSETYRCKDNSLIFVDFMSDDKTAVLRLEKKDASPVTLTVAEEGGAYVAEGGYSLSGSGATISASLPGKGSLSCKS